MRIAVISNTRRPTLPDSPWGLGNSLWALATELGWTFHEVKLFAGPGSDFKAGKLATYADEAALVDRVPDTFDAYLDGSHGHLLSKRHPDWPVVNRIGDRECEWQPPNAVVESKYMQSLYPAAKLVKKGFDPMHYPFGDAPGNYVAFYGSIITHKGPQTALEAAKKAGRTIRFAGPVLCGMSVPHYQGILCGPDRWAFLGGARVLLHPSFIDAAPRSIVEAALCGTPTICLAGDGAQEFVEGGVSGFVCTSADEMVDRLPAAEGLDRRAVREWAETHFRLDKWVESYQDLLYGAEDGETW